MWASLREAALSLRVPPPDDAPGGRGAVSDARGDDPRVALAEAVVGAAQRLAWLAALPPDERGAVAVAAASRANAPGAFPLGFDTRRRRGTNAHEEGAAAVGEEEGAAVAMEEEEGDALLHRAAVLLRCVHVAALRKLQSRADAALVAAQECTADPRTDHRLGRVGR